VGIRNWNADVVVKSQSRSSPNVKFDLFAAFVLILALGVLGTRQRGCIFSYEVGLDCAVTVATGHAVSYVSSLER
jgi:hypothetical protein